MSVLLTTLLPALLPAVGDGVRGIIAKLTGSAGANPQNVDEKIKLQNADTEKLQALAELSKPSGRASQWVTDLRESSRYIAVFLLIINAFFQAAWGENVQVVLVSWDAASSGFFFLFGDRVYLHLKKDS